MLTVGDFVVRLPKLNPGEHFEGLDMQTLLMARTSAKRPPMIEVLCAALGAFLTCSIDKC